MKRAQILLLLAVGCGPAARFDAPSETAPVALNVISLEAELAPLGLPNMDGKPFVRVTDGSHTSGPVVLLEDTAKRFTVFDGIAKESFGKGGADAPDAPAPPSFERIDEGQVARHLGKGADLPAIVFALVLRKRGFESEAQSILDGIATDPNALRAIVRENVAVRSINDAAERYAAGTTRAEYERRLQRAASMNDTKASAIATALLKASSAPSAASAARTPIDDLVQQRIDELATVRCPPEVWMWGEQQPEIARLVELGFTARAALERVKDDRHPTRCLAGGDEGSICAVDPSSCPTSEHVVGIVYLRTVGELARRALEEIDGHRAFDASDIECRGGDSSEALDVARTHDAIDVAKTTLGKVRVRIVELVGKSNDARASAFLVDEATSGPVLAARVRAADALRARGDKRWAGMIASTIDAALRSKNADRRCDRTAVAFRLASLLDAASNEALKPILAGFATYEPGVKLDVAYDVATRRVVPAGASELLAQALADTRAASTQMTFTFGTPRRHVTCDEPSASDVAAMFLGERLRIAYSCRDVPQDKALAVQKILALRGKTGGW